MIAPYIGLRYFQEKDAELFYGRDEHVGELLGKLAENRFVAVLGSSGSGKSSLVRAGLLPELRAGMIPKAGPQWKVVEFKPGRAPLGELGQALRQTFGVENAPELVEEGPLGIVRVVRAAQAAGKLAPGTNVLILADQFEEVFRFQQEDAARGRDEGQALARRLLDAAAQTDVAVYVLLVMRSDYLGECAQFPDLPERMSESLYLVPRLRRDQLEEAITAPVGDRIEPAVVQRLLAEVGSDPDQLPRLQHLLLRMWLLAEGASLTMAHYDARGGWTKGLEQHLEEVYTTVPAPACERVFRQLSELDKGRAVRRRASLAELIEVAGPEADAVVKRFREEGFLAAQSDPADITHECILREWPRARRWMESEQKDERRLRELSEAARESGWPAEKRALSGLTLENLAGWWNEAKPSAAWAWRYGLMVEEEFLRWSQSETDRLAKERESLAQQAVEATRREEEERLRRSKQAAVALGVVALILAGMGAWAWRQKSLADRQAEVALAGQLASRAELLLREDVIGVESAALLATSSIRAAPTFDGDHALRRASNLLPKTRYSLAHQGAVRTVAFSSNSKWLAAGGDDNTARVMEAATGKEVSRVVHKGSVVAVAFSPNGKWVATGSWDRTARVTEAATGAEVSRVVHQGPVVAVAFSPDGRWIATGSYDKTLRILEAATGKEVWHLDQAELVMSVAFSPDGKWVATANTDDTAVLGRSGGTARVVDLTTGKEVSRLAHNGGVSMVAFSPNSKWVATASWDKTAHVMEAATGNEVTRLIHQGVVAAVVFSPDSKWVATASGQTARVVEVATGNEVSRLACEGEVTSVAFSPNSKWVAMASLDKTVRLMEAATGREVLRLAHQGPVTAVDFSPDGAWIATGSRDDETVRVVEAPTGNEVSRFTHRGPVNAAVFSPDGKWVATRSDDVTVRLMEVATTREVWRLAHKDWVKAVNFSPDGKWLATGSNDNTARVLEVSTGREVLRLAHQGPVMAVAFSPEGKSVATGGRDKTVRLTEVATGKEVSRISFTQPVDAVAFSPDGKWIAVGSRDKFAHVIERATGHESSSFANEGPVNVLTFSPNGKWLATGSYDKTVRLVDAARGTEVSRLPNRAGVTEVTFSKDGEWLATRSDDNTVRVVHAATGAERVRLAVFAAAIRFSDDGRFLGILEHESGTYDVLYRRIAIDHQELIREVCDKVTRNLTVAEWHSTSVAKSPTPAPATTSPSRRTTKDDQPRKVTGPKNAPPASR